MENIHYCFLSSFAIKLYKKRSKIRFLHQRSQFGQKIYTCLKNVQAVREVFYESHFNLKMGNSPLWIKKDSGLCRSMFILCRSIFCLGKVQGKNVRLHLSKKYESSSDEKRMVTEIDIFSNFLELLL